MEQSTQFQDIQIQLPEPVHGLTHVRGVLGVPEWWPTGERIRRLQPDGTTVTDAEFTVDHKTKSVKVYILGPDVKKPAPIKTDKVTLSVKKPAFQLDLKPEKQAGDPEGSASVFVGTHDNFAKEQDFEGTLSAEFGGSSKLPLGFSLLLRRAAWLVVALEQQDAKLSEGAEPDVDSYQRAASTLHRLLRAMGVRCSAALLTKVAFPREILPATYVVAALVDFAIGAIVLALLMLYYQVPLSLTALWALPAIAVLAVALVGAGLLLSALQVSHRDVGLAMPVLLQLWMFASPILYPLSLVRDRLPGPVYAIYLLNPVAGIVDTFRRALLFAQPPDPLALGLSAAVAGALLPAAYLYFKLRERTLADAV